jgi:dihydropteroate synthase
LASSTGPATPSTTGGIYYELDRLLARAEQLMADGADVLEVGARPGGVGVAEVGPDEERDLAAGTIAALRSRFDVPPAVDTTRAGVAEGPSPREPPLRGGAPEDSVG